MISQEDFEWFTEAFFFISQGKYSKFGLGKGQVVMRYNIEKDSVCWNEDFRYYLNMICSEAFIDANLAFYEGRIFNIECGPCLIDITNYIRTKDNVKAIDKVRFCVSWLNTFQLRKDGFSCQGIVHVDDKDFDCMQHTDFTSYMQSIGIITLEEHIEINKDWLDPTSDEPYYL